MLVWQSLGCQLHSNNAVVASVSKDFKFVTDTEAVLECHIGVTLMTCYPKTKQ